SGRVGCADGRCGLLLRAGTVDGGSLLSRPDDCAGDGPRRVRDKTTWIFVQDVWHALRRLAADAVAGPAHRRAAVGDWPEPIRASAASTVGCDPMIDKPHSLSRALRV